MRNSELRILNTPVKREKRFNRAGRFTRILIVSWIDDRNVYGHICGKTYRLRKTVPPQNSNGSKE